MKFNRSEPGLLFSGGAHAAVLLAALLAFRAEPFDDASESVPVEIISASQLAEMMKGEREAKIQAPAPRPRVDRVAEAKDTRPPTPLDAKLEIPAPPARPPEPEKPEPVSQPPAPPERPKADDDQGARDKAAQDKAAREKAAEAKAEADAKAAQLEAEALERAKAEKAKEAKAKEDQAKADKAKADAKAKAEADAAREAKAKEAQKLAALAAEASKPAPTPKPTDKPFNPADIERLLKSKEKPQAPAATGAELNKTASLGSPTATGQKLNPGQREQLGRLLKEQLIQCWSPPANMANVDNLRPRIRMQLNQDGTLAAEPGIMNNSDDPGFRPMAESAARAVRKCAPFKIPPEFMPFYSDWRVWSVTFDAKEMLG